MKKLNTYILEKLHLNKDISYKPKVGDKVLMIINQCDRNSLDKEFPKPHGKQCFLKVSKIKEVNDNIVIVPFYRKYGYSNEKPQLLEFKLVEIKNLHYAELVDKYDQNLHGVLLSKEVALENIRDWIKTRKGVIKYPLTDKKEYSIWKPVEMPMFAYLGNIEQSLLD